MATPRRRRISGCHDGADWMRRGRDSPRQRKPMRRQIASILGYASEQEELVRRANTAG
jgi:hypothetical protein